MEEKKGVEEEDGVRDGWRWKCGTNKRDHDRDALKRVKPELAKEGVDLGVTEESRKDCV